MLAIRRTNTIIYCASWAETVAFYGERLGLHATFENDWFVEFELTSSSYLSVADHTRSTITPNQGSGLTLSWEVPDLGLIRSRLIASGIDVGELGSRWGATTLDLYDPERNRIELWSTAL
jgi:catechol 2,3-dioxygenase-like lactoylglutathione lyase family enzyme